MPFATSKPSHSACVKRTGVSLRFSRMRNIRFCPFFFLYPAKRTVLREPLNAFGYPAAFGGGSV